MKNNILFAVLFIIAAGCSTEQPPQTHRLADAPVLFSKTHSQDEWSADRVAIIQWKIPVQEIKGYAIMINKKAQYDVQPLVNLDPDATRYTTPKLSDGISYFHLRYIGDDNYPSKTAHYRINVCAEEPKTPSIISPTHPEGKGVTRRDPKFVWESGGACIKGYYYSLKKGGPAEPDRFVKNNGIEFNNCEPGVYTFSMRAVSETGQKGERKIYTITINP